MRDHRFAFAFLGVLAASVPAAGAAHASAGYRANLVACIRGTSACDESVLSKADSEYLETDRTSRTRDPRMANKIADARMQKPVRIVVTEDRLDHLHDRSLKFELYRSRLRVLEYGWVPGVNKPYQQPPEGWAVPPRRRHIRNGVAGSQPPLAEDLPFQGAANLAGAPPVGPDLPPPVPGYDVPYGPGKKF